MTAEALDQAVAHLVERMKDYVDMFLEQGRDAPYPKTQADQCGRILERYLARIAKGLSNTEILAEVEKTVKELNALNEKSGLIDTEEREQLCDIIIEGARLNNYTFNEDALDDDITAEWRDW